MVQRQGLWVDITAENPYTFHPFFTEGPSPVRYPRLDLKIKTPAEQQTQAVNVCVSDYHPHTQSGYWVHMIKFKQEQREANIKKKVNSYEEGAV